MIPSIAILITGSEVLDGRILDTNSHRAIVLLRNAGFTVSEVIKVPDNLALLKDSLAYLARRNRCIIMSGGLGPTSDDLTRDAVAEVTGDSLSLRESVLEEIQHYFVRRGRKFDPSNTKQAFFPSRAQVIPNPAGTAPGFFSTLSLPSSPPCIIAALPGIPLELEEMLTISVIPALWEKLCSRTSAPEMPQSWSARIFGLTESNVQTRVRTALVPEDLIVSYRVVFPEIELTISAPELGYNTQIFQEAIARTRSSIEEEFIVAAPSRELDEVLHGLLLSHTATVSVAESSSAGMLAASLTKYPGSSKYFQGGFFVYQDDLKRDLLGVGKDTLQKYGAVSFEAAKEMAEAVRERAGSSAALSITGFAGPEGGTSDAPTGTFFVGFSSPENSTSYKFFFPGPRERNRRFSVYAALDILRRSLLGIPVRAPSHENRGKS